MAALVSLLQGERKFSFLHGLLQGMLAFVRCAFIQRLDPDSSLRLRGSAFRFQGALIEAVAQ